MKKIIEETLITVKTQIPVGLAIIAIGGGAMWITELHSIAVNASQGVYDLREKRDKDQELLHAMDTKLTTVETILKEMKENGQGTYSRKNR